MPKVALFRSIFPELKTAWAYIETCPGAGQGSEVHQAKELLMREYTLRGEQNLREGSPQNAAKDVLNWRTF
jgi:hypothetical protein